MMYTGGKMRRIVLTVMVIIVCCSSLFAASNSARMGAQIGLGVVGGAAGFMIGTANACCVSCVSFAAGPNIKDLKFLSGTMTIGGLVGTVLGGTAGVYFTGNSMVDDGVEIENPWEIFFATMGGGLASCATGYVLDLAMHKARGDEDARPGAFYLVGLMLSPIAETFVYHHIVKERISHSTASGYEYDVYNGKVMYNPKIIQMKFAF
jgi:MFS family permease